MRWHPWWRRTALFLALVVGFSTVPTAPSIGQVPSDMGDRGSVPPSSDIGQLAAAIGAVPVNASFHQTPTQMVDGSVSYVYDALGQLTGFVASDGTAVGYVYDETGNLVSRSVHAVGSVGVVGFEPPVGRVGDVITVHGTGFSSVVGENTVEIGAVAATPTAATTTSISFEIPQGAATGQVTVTSPSGSATSSHPLVVRSTGSVTIGSVTPTLVDPGQTLTVTGSGFDPKPENNKVRLPYIGSTILLQVLTASANELTVEIPQARPNTGYLTVTSPQGMATSSEVVAIPPAPYGASTTDYAGSIPFDSTTRVSVTTANRDAFLTFEGTAGQRVSMLESGTSGGFNTLVGVYRPSGAKVVEGWGWWFDTFVLPETGVYSIVVDPESTTTGSTDLTLYEVPPDETGLTATIGGDPVTITTTVPGQNATLTFEGTAGQRVSMLESGTSGGFNTLVGVYRPSGAKVVEGWGWWFDTFVLPETGTYTLKVDGQNNAVGSTTLTLYEVPPDETGLTATIGGDPVTITTTVPGQNATLTFEGTAGQSVRLDVVDVSMNALVGIYTQSGTKLAEGWGSSVGPISLPATATYLIKVDPASNATGSVDLTLVDLTVQSPAIYVFNDWNGGYSLLGRLADGLPAGERSVVVATTSQEEPASPEGEQAELAPFEESEDADPPGTAEFEPGTERWTPPKSGKPDLVWRAEREPSPWAEAAALLGDPELPSVSGQVLTLNGLPLAGVAVSVSTKSTKTDRMGRFLLEGVSLGHQGVVVDGTGLAKQGSHYPLFEIGVDVAGDGTTVLEAPVWMPLVDERTLVRVPEVARRDYVVTSPDIPGLEIRVPRGARITNYWGEAITELTITPVPSDRAPFPLPEGVEFPVYFTVQPGGVYIEPGAQIVYPNVLDLAPGTRVAFYNYDPEERGWYVYGAGTVTKDGSQVVPDPGVEVYQLTMFSYIPGFSDWLKDLFEPVAEGEDDGDPVDLASGRFTYEKSDLVLPDVVPIGVSRSYNSGSGRVRAFGVGMTHSYDLFLRSDNPFQEVDLILPDGAKIHYVRTSAGTGHTDAVFEHTTTPTKWHGSKIVWNGNGWDLELADGTVLVFGNKAPLQRIIDRNGNRVEINRQGDYYGSETGYVTAVVSPNGRWLNYSYDGSNRVSTVTDNLGRTVAYQYDASGRLWKVTDPDGGVTTYSYDSSHRMTSITDARGIVFLSNGYDSNGRVITQTTAGEGEASFAYTLDGSGKVTQTEYTDPAGRTRRVAFNGDGYPTTDTGAVGTIDEQTTTIERQTNTNLVAAVVDPLGRRSEYTYDSAGYVTSATALAGTADAVTTTYSYELTFHQLATVTDPLNHTTSYSYDTTGNLIRIDDPAGRSILFDHNAAGQVTEVRDDLDQTTTYTYDHGDPAAAVDPLGRSTETFIDAAGRVARTLDPVGATTQVEFNKRNLATKVTDPAGQATTLGYDPNGNLTTVTDPRGGVLGFAYDDADRLATKTDPLGVLDTYSYDTVGNLASVTDRRGQVTEFSYDNLDRPTLVRFGVSGSTEESSIAYTYDDGDRLTGLTDSASGTISYVYDGLDRLSAETTPLGTISYTYDDAGRRITSTVTGETTVDYAWDPSGLPTTITQGSATITYSYDAVGRVQTISAPTNLTTSYVYDAASQLTSITHTQGSTTLGDLTYAYNTTGRVGTMGGSDAGLAIPTVLGSAVYDLANRISTWDGQAFTWDAAGNLTSDGTSTYTWNARGQLASVTQGTTTWTHSYDGTGRRIGIADGATLSEHLYDGPNPRLKYIDGNPVTTLLGGIGLDTHQARTTSGTTISYLTDRLGSTVSLANSIGITANYTYTPFGQPVIAGDPGGNDLALTGRPLDPSGLYQLRARYYHPGLQRFISEDPLGLAGGPTNHYLYASNDPINLTDRTGLAAETLASIGSIVYDSYELFAGGRKNQSGDSLWDLFGEVDRFVSSLMDWILDRPEQIAACFYDMFTCSDNVHIALFPLLIAAMSVAVLSMGIAACSSGPAGCVAGLLVPIPAGIAGLAISVPLAKELWFSDDPPYRPLSAPWRK